LFPPAIYGGGEYIFYQWAKEFVNRGNKVVVITQALKNHVFTHEIIDGIEVHRVLPIINYTGQLSINIIHNIGFLFSALIKGLSLNRIHGFDIIHSNTYTPALVGKILSFLLKKPYIITIHDIYLINKKFWINWSSQKGISNLNRFTAPLFEKMILSLNPNIIHTVSETSKKDIKKYVNNKIVVIPNGINIEEYKSIYKVRNNKESTKSVLFIGRLVFYKNVQTIIKAFKIVLKSLPEYKLIIIGDGPYKTNLEKMTVNYTDKIIFKGRISDKLKHKYISESSLLLMPSTVEGFGIVVLEAYSYKKPVISSNIMPLPEIVINGITGYNVNPYDHKEWANKIIDLINNQEKNKRMGLKGHKMVLKNYTITRTVDKLESIYKSLI
jgi:glycosyltransferase involved in cell wall biosynthesis